LTLGMAPYPFPSIFATTLRSAAATGWSLLNARFSFGDLCSRLWL